MHLYPEKNSSRFASRLWLSTYHPFNYPISPEAAHVIPKFTDIDENAAKALATFDIDIDALLAEIKIDMDIRELERDLKKHEPDFGR